MSSKKYVRLGLEKILNENIAELKGLRVGLVCNQGTVDHQYLHAADLFYEHPKINLVALFGPQHGIRGDVQDNMVETAHTIDKYTNLPVYSLYSETRKPTLEMVENVDVLVFDLQDVGCRVYTFIYTLAYLMQTAAETGKKVIVLDRPNPIGGEQVEGDLLERGHESFVGLYSIPMRHGMTIGEIARLFNERFGIKCDLTVIKMDNWERSDYLDEIDAPWVMPSPNMPTVATAVVFPGTVYFEGTQVSEGRGTTKPFETVGAQYIDSRKLAEQMNSLKLPGVYFRSIEFMPTFQKFAQIGCGGVFLHVLDRREFKPVAAGIALLKTIRDFYPEEFQWKTTPYEYVFDRNPFDVIAGNTKLRKQLEDDVRLKDIFESWSSDENDFFRIRQEYLLY